MRVLIHSNGPMVPSGYGVQTKLLIGVLRELGHDVAVSAFYGVSGRPIFVDGVPILPAGRQPYGTDVLIQHAAVWGAEVVITLMDVWKLLPIADELRAAPFEVVSWLANDCEPLGHGDRVFLERSGARPVAMSRFGQRNLSAAGWEALYAPHMLEAALYPVDGEERQKLRAALGIVAETPVIGIVAANNDALRKAFPEQFQAFSQFRARQKRTGRPEPILMVHSQVNGPNAHDLGVLANDLGIADRVIMSDTYAQVAGQITPDRMRELYGAMDWLSSCSYAEAFGVPIIEAKACGTPVIGTRGSAVTENVGKSGLLVSGTPFWNAVHRAWWTRPDVKQITAAYIKAADMRALERESRSAAAVDEVIRLRPEMQVEVWGQMLEEVTADE